MAKVITDMETWLLDHGDRIYRYLVYKKMFTPYEQNQAFSDESIYESMYFALCKIEEAIDLGNGEWMFGIKDVNDDGETCGRLTYYKTNEIRLSLFDKDQDLTIFETLEEDD